MDRTVYIVQTTFPSYRDGEVKPDRFGEYTWSTYTPIREPGARKLFFGDPEWAPLLTRLERANYKALRTHRYNESLAYLTAEAAFETAQALRDHAVLACRYEHNVDWAIRERGMRLQSRVVEHRLASIDRVVLEP